MNNQGEGSETSILKAIKKESRPSTDKFEETYKRAMAHLEQIAKTEENVARQSKESSTFTTYYFILVGQEVKLGNEDYPNLEVAQFDTGKAALSAISMLMKARSNVISKVVVPTELPDISVESFSSRLAKHFADHKIIKIEDILKKTDELDRDSLDTLIRKTSQLSREELEEHRHKQS